MVEGCFFELEACGQWCTKGIGSGSSFVINVNDLDKNIEGMVSKFVDDSEEGFLRLQRDLDQMGQWAEKWQMEFNPDKREELGHYVEVVQDTGEASSGILRPVLVAQLYEGYYQAGEGSEETYQDVAGMEGLSYKESLDTLG
eukprot:g38807.t1